MDKEIRNQLNEQDRQLFDDQLHSINDTSPLQITFQHADGSDAAMLQAHDLDSQYKQGSQVPVIGGSQLAFQQMPSNLQSRTFFSISESKKISKYLFKIEQCLIKEFGVKTQNLMERTYEALKQKD